MNVIDYLYSLLGKEKSAGIQDQLATIGTAGEQVVYRARKDAANVEMFVRATVQVATERLVAGLAAAQNDGPATAVKAIGEAETLFRTLWDMSADATQLAVEAGDLATKAADIVRGFQFPKDLFNLGRIRRRVDDVKAEFAALDHRSFLLREKARQVARAYGYPKAVVDALG